MSNKGDMLIPEPANPGASATLTIYDSSKAAANGNVAISNKSERRAKIFLYANQIVTVNVYGKSASGTYRLIQTQASVANTALTKELPFYGDDVKIDLVTTTAPTTWECSLRLCDEQSALT